MKKLVKKVLLVILAVVMLLGAFVAGAWIATEEADKQHRVQMVASRNNDYRKIIAEIPSIKDRDDRLFLIGILNQGPTEYWDDNWLFDYEYTYTYSHKDGSVDVYKGLVENAGWRTLMSDICAMEEIDILGGSSEFGREAL